MARNEQSPINTYVEVPSLIYQLCAKETKLSGDLVSQLYGVTINLVGSASESPLDDTDEFYIMEKIKKQLSRENRESDALRLEELYHKLKRQPSVKNPASLLMFLYCMHNENEPQKLPLLHSMNSKAESYRSENGVSKRRSYMLTSSSSLASIINPDLTKLLPTGDSNDLTGTFLNHANGSSKPKMRTSSGSSRNRPHSVHGLVISSTSKEVADVELLREVLFSFQGLNGRILVQDPNNDNRYHVNPKYKVNPSTKMFALRLSNMGWLFNKINKFCQHVTKDQSNGHVLQSFAAALSEEILEYYRLITVIEQQLHGMSSYTNEGNDEYPPVSLHRLQIWSFDHYYRLKMLASLVENCKHKRGGALANYVYNHMQHGDPQLKCCLTRILNQVVLPIRCMLSRWIFYGEIDDPHEEFFISIKGGTESGDSLWHEKYTINNTMLPGFIPIEQAKKILATGKAINLLLQVSTDHSYCVPGYDDLKDAFERTDVELLFKESKSPSGEKGEFRKLLQSAYKETSLKARRILFEDYKLIKHLNGLRQFLLLGQGDFIRHLMDLLAPELDKPVKKLQAHSLNNLLNCAIRATNAQFLDEDVINRVDSLLANSNTNDQDTGWDIFTLAYQTKGPIGTILTQRCMEKYSKLFKHLWHSKRMEYVLSALWKKQKFNDKSLKMIPQMKHLYHQCYVLLAEMTHFVQQMQYYMEFEVIECSWAEFTKKIESSEDVDQLVEAHEWFLDIINSRAMLSIDAEELNIQLRRTYSFVLSFKEKIDDLSKLVDYEVEQRIEFDANQRTGTNVTNDEIQLENERRHTFESETIPKFLGKMRLISGAYQLMVQELLLLLSAHTDMDLQFLRVRIDFNEHYKKRNKTLETSLTYSHRHSIDFSK